MQHKRILVLLAALLVLISFALPAGAALVQEYQMVNFTIDGGGTLLSDGDSRFQLNATIGQPDASGMLIAQGVSLTGGYWSEIQANGGNDIHIFLPLVSR